MPPSLDKVLYTGRVHTTGGRDGSAKSDDGRIDVKLTHFGASGTGTNPEQLLAAGWSACYLSAVAHVARQKKVALPADAAVDAEVDLGTGGGGYLLSARLKVTLPGLDRQVAQSLADEAHGTCPYSKALHGNINIATTVAV